MRWPLVGRDLEAESIGAAIRSDRGVAIHGAAGVGKSRLLEESLTQLDADGWKVTRVFASESAATVPFGAFVDFIPRVPTRDRFEMLRAAAEELDRISDQHMCVIAIDDAHHLDELSIAFVGLAMTRDKVRIACSIRTGEPLSEDLVGWWSGGRLQRIDVSPLSIDSVNELLTSVLSPEDLGLMSELWRLSRGNPLVLTELVSVLTSTDSGSGTTGEMMSAPRLADLVSSRLSRLDDGLRVGMDIVAAGYPIPRQIADAAVGARSLIELEARGLIDAGPQVRPAHPLYGEILAAHLGDVRRTAALRTLVAASVSGDGSLVAHDVDPLRVAMWQFESGTVVSSRLAIDGGTMALARHEPEIATMLAESVGMEDPGAAVLRGQTLHYQRRYREAEDILASVTPAVESGGDEDAIVSLALTRAQNLAFGLHLIPEATRVIDQAFGHVTSDMALARLRNERAVALAAIGHLSAAVVECRSVLAMESIDAVTRASAYVTLTVALVMAGDAEGMAEVVDDAVASARLAATELPFAEAQVEIMAALGEFLDLDLDAAQSRLREAAARMSGAAAPMVAVTSGVLGPFSGAVASLADTVAKALVVLDANDPFGLAPMGGGVKLTLDVLRFWSDPDRPIVGVAAVEAPPRVSAWVDNGRAWSAARNGDVDGAVSILMESAALCESADHLAWSAINYYSCVRVGAAAEALVHLERIDKATASKLISAMADHARALVARDPEGTESVGATFAAAGAHFLAAEAYSTAGELFVAGSDAIRAARCELASAYFLSRCEGASSLAVVEPSVLTPREIEMALAAASGEASRDIAEQRYLSVRTVDNHLRNAYQKLSVDGRSGLQALTR